MAGTSKHVEKLLIERPRVGPLVAEPQVGDPEGGPRPGHAHALEHIDRLAAKTPLEVIGHGLHRRRHCDRHGGSADQRRPQPGLRVEIRTRQINQACPLGKAKVIAPDTATAGRGLGVWVREIVKRETTGSAGIGNDVHGSCNPRGEQKVRQPLKTWAGRESHDGPCRPSFDLAKASAPAAHAGSLGQPCSSILISLDPGNPTRSA